MRRCGVAVMGLGLMGSAALHALVRRGADVLGFDALPVGVRGRSSYGSCRVYRRFNFESEAYTELSDQAFAGWRALESASGRSILKPMPVLEAGPAGSLRIAASRTAALKAGPVLGPATGGEANAAFPAFRLPEDWDVVVQQSGGILMAEAALRAFREGAGNRIVAQHARIEPTREGIRVRTDTDEFLAEQVIVAAGPRIRQLIPQLARHLTVTRQAVGWFTPARPELVGPERFPIFILHEPGRNVYGFPDFEARGVKAAQHDLGQIVEPDAWDRPAKESELAIVAATLGDLIPAAAGPIAELEICLYTNTLKADAVTDMGGEFIVDRLPQNPRIIVASPCSGHGAKFATAIGDMLASLALSPGFDAPSAFRLDRFSSFAGARS